jgi:hypothetical protein
MARRCTRFKRTSAGRRCAKFSGTKKGKRRSYRGYGKSVRVYSGFGKLDVGLDAVLPPAVGVGTTMGTTLILRAFVDPEVKDENGALKMDKDNNPEIHWAFKYAGLIGAGAGVATSLALGFFQGWGSAVVGGISALGSGLTAQFYNKVVKEEAGDPAVKRRQLYAWKGYGRSPYGLVALQQRGGGESVLMQPSGFGRGGYGMIGAQPNMARNFLVAGRGTSSMPTEVLRQVNAAAWGGSASVM